MPLAPRTGRANSESLGDNSEHQYARGRTLVSEASDLGYHSSPYLASMSPIRRRRPFTPVVLIGKVVPITALNFGAFMDNITGYASGVKNHTESAGMSLLLLFTRSLDSTSTHRQSLSVPGRLFHVVNNQIIARAFSCLES